MKFNKKLRTLLLGNVSAQLIIALSSVVLTRVYNAQDFGIFGLTVAICIVVSHFATLSLENSLMHEPEKTEKYVGLFIILLTSVAVSALCFGVLSFIAGSEIKKITLTVLDAALISVSLFLYSAQKTLTQYKLSTDRYDNVAKSRFLQATITVLAQFSLSKTNSGLVLGYAIGLLAGNLVLLSELSFTKKGYTVAIIKSFFVKHYRFPLYQSPASLFAAFSSNMVYFILSWKFPISFIGAYALSNRVISTPLTYFTTSVGQAYYAEVTKNADEISKITLNISKKSWLFSFPVFFVFSLISNLLFEYAFGREWLESSEISILLSPMFAISFVISPLSYAFAATHTQKYDLMLTFVFLLFRAVGLYIGVIQDSPLIGIYYFSILGSLAYVIYGIYIFKVTHCTSRDILSHLIIPSSSIWILIAVCNPGVFHI